MAVTINNLWGAETGGLEEASASIGSPTASTTQAHSGTYSYRLTPGDTLDFSMFESVASAGNNHIIGFWIRFDTVDSGLTQDFLEIHDSGGKAIGLGLAFTDGNLRVSWVGGSTEYTSGPYFSDNTWHFVELYFQNLNSGDFEVFIDGVSKASNTARDFVNSGTVDTIKFATANVGGARSWYLDDMYWLSDVTDETDRLGGCEVFSYRSSKASATPDLTSGDALDAGQWADAQEIGFGETNVASYEAAGAQSGAVVCDDVGGSAGTGGPFSDANIDGDSNIKAAKGVWRMQRSGGSDAQQIGRIGNSSATSATNLTSTGDLNITTSYVNYFLVYEGGTGGAAVPSSSQRIVIGMEKSTGGQDLDLSDMLAQVLHVPGAWVQRPRRVSVIT